MEDDYIKERANDIRDVARRLLKNLAGEDHHDLEGLTEASIIVAPDISPSEVALFDKDKVLAFVSGTCSDHGPLHGHSCHC